MSLLRGTGAGIGWGGDTGDSTSGVIGAGNCLKLSTDWLLGGPGPWTIYIKIQSSVVQYVCLL